MQGVAAKQKESKIAHKILESLFPFANPSDQALFERTAKQAPRKASAGASISMNKVCNPDLDKEEPRS